MGWLSFGSTKEQPTSAPPPAYPPAQLQQRSHHQLSPTPQQTVPKPPAGADSDIETTLHQLKGTTPSHDIKLHTADDASKIGDFIAHYPVSNMFIIDGEKDTRQSIICTSNQSGGKTCLKLGISAIELFRTMQKLEYFCSLPNDINATYFECRKIQ